MMMVRLSGFTRKYMWHFWGNPEELQGSLKVMGTRKETGEKITVIAASSIGGPNNGADGCVPSNMALPSPGLWRLDAYIGQKLFGSIIVEVHEKSETSAANIIVLMGVFNYVR
jgi:hypothetical protein